MLYYSVHAPPALCGRHSQRMSVQACCEAGCCLVCRALYGPNKSKQTRTSDRHSSNGDLLNLVFRECHARHARDEAKQEGEIRHDVDPGCDRGGGREQCLATQCMRRLGASGEAAIELDGRRMHIPDLRQVRLADQVGESCASLRAENHVDERPQAKDQDHHHAPTASQSHSEAKDGKASVADGDVDQRDDQFHHTSTLVVAPAANEELRKVETECNQEYDEAIEPEDVGTPARPSVRAGTARRDLHEHRIVSYRERIRLHIGEMQLATCLGNAGLSTEQGGLHTLALLAARLQGRAMLVEAHANILQRATGTETNLPPARGARLDGAATDCVAEEHEEACRGRDPILGQEE
mmetsp:Transcript_96426/g.310923  ORF Transcript_96426/g.310923 Transcript_96426/m.310923 type:complete len:352 (-) Transcript_96426:784-1839(-)